MCVLVPVCVCVCVCAQFDNLAGFSAVIDRLGQFQEVMGKAKLAAPTTPPATAPAPNGAATDASAAVKAADTGAALVSVGEQQPVASSSGRTWPGKDTHTHTHATVHLLSPDSCCFVLFRVPSPQTCVCVCVCVCVT